MYNTTHVVQCASKKSNYTGGHSVADVRVVHSILRHEVLDELDVRVARSLHTRVLPLLFLCTQDAFLPSRDVHARRVQMTLAYPGYL